MTEENKQLREDRFLTIREFFEAILDAQGVQVFMFIYDGSLYAGTDKKPARVPIVLPRTVVDRNLKDLDKFAFFGVAVPREIIAAIPDKEEG